jgi:hypothetical protein
LPEQAVHEVCGLDQETEDLSLVRLEILEVGGKLDGRVAFESIGNGGGGRGRRLPRRRRLRWPGRGARDQ